MENNLRSPVEGLSEASETSEAKRSAFVALDTSRMNVLATDIRMVKKFTASTDYPENTVIYVMIPTEYSTNTIVPTIGHLFLGVVNRPSCGITTTSLSFTINDGPGLPCRNVFGYLRPDRLPITLEKSVKIRVGVPSPTDMLELAFLAAPNAATLYTVPNRSLPDPPPIDESELEYD